MALSTEELIKARAAEQYRRFLKETDSVTLDEANRFVRANWPAHRWGIGQNGSIAGIVIHVAAWKQMTLPLLRGESAISIQQFDIATHTSLTDWSGIVAWYRQIGQEWLDRIDELSDEDLARPLLWEGMTITMTKLVMEIVDHDIQHASQIEYLKQMLRIEP